VVGPRYRAADGHERPGGAVVVGAVGELDELNRGRVAEVVVGIACGDGVAGDELILPGDGADVGVLSGDGSDRSEGDRGGRAWGVGSCECADGEVVGGVARCAVVVLDVEILHLHVALPIYVVGPRYRAADGHERPGGAVVVGAVGELDKLNRGRVAEVVVG